MQTKHGDEVVVIVSQTMDLLEANDTQSLANSLHDFLENQNCLKQFDKMDNKHKDLLKQQRLGFVAKCFKEFNMANARKIEAMKWDWNSLWHVINNEKCLFTTEKPKLPWSHSFEEVKIITSNFLCMKTTLRNVVWEVWLVKVFFWHSLDNDVNCACPLQGINNTSIGNMRMGEYHLAWWKTINI